MIYRFERRGRRWTNVLSLIGIWLVLLAVWAAFDLAPWVVLFFGAFTLPVLWDLVRDPRVWVEVWPNRLVWRGTLSGGDRSDILLVQLNRRFDGTFRIAIVHTDDAVTRVPPDIAPPPGVFEAALTKAGIRTERHPFLNV